MRYKIKYKCGHEENVNLNGRQNSQSYADWLAAGVCKKCYEAEKIAERNAYNEAEGLPELTGTPRQVEWANKLRYELYKKIKALLQYVDKSEEDYKKQFVEWLKSQNTATFWINNRDKSEYDIINYWSAEVLNHGK